MTVVYDLIGVQNRDHGERGIARYVLQLALALERRHPGLVDQYLIHPHLPVPGDLEPLLSSGRVRRADDRDPDRRPSAGGVFLAGSIVELQEPIDRLLPHFARSPQWRRAAVLYDLIPLRFPDWYLTEPAMNKAYRTRVRSLTSFDHLLPISQASADDAATLLGVGEDRMTIIWAGADARFQKPTTDHREVAEQLTADVAGLRPGYLMFPSGIERRKNVERLFEAYGRIPESRRQTHQLVLVCRVDDHERAELVAVAERLGFADDLLITGFVADDVLVRLYQGADLVVFPAIYEGYGLPVLEAIRCGAPVLCSDSSSLREVQPDPTRRFDPYDVDAIAVAVDAALHAADSGTLSRDQPPPDHSWERAADLTAEALRAAPRLRIAGPGRPRLGVVTPMPPQQSGIATYARRLLEPLAHDVDITVFVDPESGPVDPVGGLDIQPLSRLGAIVASGGAFDELLYFMGNSSFHVEAVETLRRHPGRVLFHDARMTGLYSEIRRLHPDRLPAGAVGAAIEAWYPNRYRPAVQAMQVISPDQADRFGILMAREIASYATEVLVHSEYAKTLLHLDTGVEPHVVFPIPAPVTDAVRQPAPATISTFGIVAPVKAPDLLMEALGLVIRSVPNARLRFVGGLDEPYLRHLRSIASDFGVADQVDFTGHVDDEAFAAEQATATVAVQLRLFTNGESSAAVTELLAAGVPTVVSSEASMGELPPDAVRHVDPSVGASALAAVLVDLLIDVERREALATSGRGYADAHSFAAAADILRAHLFGR